MPLNQQSFDTLVSNQITAIQAVSSSFQEFTPGSILLALVESNAAAVGLYLQAIIAQVLATTRLATSQGSDVDSFVNDFNLTRLPATYASGNVTFSRFTNTSQAVIPIGATVTTANGQVSYTVTLDTTNVNYNAGLGGYIIAIGISSISVPVQCTVAGSVGNASIGAITLLSSAIPYVDTVNNTASLTNGIDQESDSALKTRFSNYINTLYRATKAAIGYAITIAGQNLTYSLSENLTYNQVAQLGYFYAIVDDGSHATPSATLNTVGSSIELYRGFTVQYSVFAPTTITANVSLTITTASGYIHSQIVTLVQTAITNYINSLTLGVSLPYTRLEEVAYDTSPAVINVTSVLLNSATLDINPTNLQVVIAGTVTVT